MRYGPLTRHWYGQSWSWRQRASGTNGSRRNQGQNLQLDSPQHAKFLVAKIAHSRTSHPGSANGSCS